MKKIGHYLQKKSLQKKTPLDEKSILYVFDRVVRREYGNRGAESLKIDHFQDKKIFIKAENSNWAGEVWINRDSFIEKLNSELGSREIEEISVK